MTERKRILIVEDESITAMDLSDRLKKLGYVVVAVVSNGEDAVDKAVELKPDIILMDIKIKGNIDGIEAARRINEIHRIPLFYLTAYSDESLILRAKMTKPYGYMLKPFTTREIHANIEVGLHRYEIEQKLAVQCRQLDGDYPDLCRWGSYSGASVQQYRRIELRW